MKMVLTNRQTNARGEYDGTRYERITWCDPEPAGGNLLCVSGRRRGGRGPFQLRPVWVGDQLSTRSKGPDSFEVAGYIQAAFLGRAVGHPVWAPHRGRLEIAIPVRLSIRPSAAVGSVSDLPAPGRRGVLRASPGADIHALPAAGESALRDNHRFGCQGDHREASVAPGTRVKGLESNSGSMLSSATPGATAAFLVGRYLA